MKFKLIVLSSFFYFSLQLFSCDKQEEKIFSCSILLGRRGDISGTVSKIELLNFDHKKITYKVCYNDISQNQCEGIFNSTKMLSSDCLKKEGSCLTFFTNQYPYESYVFSLNSNISFAIKPLSEDSLLYCDKFNIFLYQTRPKAPIIETHIGRICSPIVLQGIKNNHLIYIAFFRRNEIEREELMIIKSQSIIPEAFNIHYSFLIQEYSEDSITKYTMQTTEKTEIRMDILPFFSWYLILRDNPCLPKDLAPTIILLLNKLRFA